VTRIARLLVACLLIAALPLQGIAAASMAFCATGGSPAAAQAAPHGHDGAAAHTHAVAATPDGSATALPDTAHACSVCMACCHAVGLVQTAEFGALQPSPQGPIAAASAPLYERPASVLERPPRA
jgi:hypothetical protein